MNYSPESILRDVHPKASPAFRRLTEDLYSAYENRKTSTYFRPFEGLRAPIKQQELLNQRPAVTHVGPWHSAHQYGLAVDFVGWTPQRWSWDEREDWAYLRLAAERCGLRRPLEWDLGHIEHPSWVDVQKVLFGKS